MTEEPGRQITPDGRIVYSWPPEGRYAVLWNAVDAVFPDDGDKSAVLALLRRWQHETSTLVAYTNEEGEWVDVEPDWSVPRSWWSKRGLTPPGEEA